MLVSFGNEHQELYGSETEQHSPFLNDHNWCLILLLWRLFLIFIPYQ